MEVKKIEIVKDWPEPKSVCNIQVFLGFANFYRQFIQGFSKIATLFTLMLKMTRSSDEPASNRKNGSKPASGKKDGNGKVNEFGGDSMEQTKKSGKSKSQNSAKSQKLSTSGKSKGGKSKGEKSKKPSKSANLPNFGIIKAKPSFLTPGIMGSL